MKLEIGSNEKAAKAYCKRADFQLMDLVHSFNTCTLFCANTHKHKHTHAQAFFLSHIAWEDRKELNEGASTPRSPFFSYTEHQFTHNRPQGRHFSVCVCVCVCVCARLRGWWCCYSLCVSTYIILQWPTLKKTSHRCLWFFSKHSEKSGLKRN